MFQSNVTRINEVGDEQTIHKIKKQKNKETKCIGNCVVVNEKFEHDLKAFSKLNPSFYIKIRSCFIFMHILSSILN
jgi:hypothetical protein